MKKMQKIGLIVFAVFVLVSFVGVAVVRADLTTSSTAVTSSGAFTLVFEGATADDYETTLGVTDPTADRTITFPDVTGNVLVGGSNTVTVTSAGGGSQAKMQWKQTTNALTGDLEGLHVRVSSDVGSANNALNGAQIKAVANDVASQIDVEVLRGVYTSVDAKDNLVTTARAFEASLDGMAGSTITEAVGIELMNNSSGTQTASYGLSINGGTASGHKAYTADIRLQNGELVSNATDGTILLGGTAGNTLDIGSAASNASVRSGTAVPTACSAGDIFIDTDSADPTAALYMCDSDEDGDGNFDVVTVVD